MESPVTIVIALTWLLYLGSKYGGRAATKSFLATQEPHKAVALYQRILQRDSKHLQANYSRATVLYRSGNNQAALMHISRVLAQQPEHVDSQILLGNVLMAQAEQQGAASRQNKMYLAYALGKVFVDLQEYDKAFAYLQRANGLRRESLPAPYSGELEQQQFSHIKATFTAEKIVRSFR